MATNLTPAPLTTPITNPAGPIAGQSPWWIWFGVLVQYINGLFASWTIYTPSLTSTMTLSAETIHHAEYQQVGSTAFLYCDVSFTLAGTASTSVSLSLPGAAAGWGALNARLVDNGAMVAAVAFINAGKIEVQRADGSNFVLGPCEMFVSGSYRVS